MHLRIAFFAAILAGTVPVHAQDASYAQTDAELNRLFQKIESRIAHNPDSKQKLVAAQRAWIAFRDNECNSRPPVSKAAASTKMSLKLVCRN